MRRMRRLNEAGWTLMEVMVVTGMILILAGIAAPQYSQLTGQMRSSGAATQLLGNLQWARSMSLRTGVPHYLATNGAGAVVYQVRRSAAPPLLNPASDPILRQIDLSTSMPGIVFQANGAQNDPWGLPLSGPVPAQPLAFDGRGLPSGAGTFVVSTADGNFGYAVALTGAGRTRIFRQNDAGGWQ